MNRTVKGFERLTSTVPTLYLALACSASPPAVRPATPQPAPSSPSPQPEVAPAVTQCETKKVEIIPNEGYPLDTCKLQLRCGETLLDVLCDDEQDGTGTSLCDCSRNGMASRAVGGLFRSEGVATCYAAAERCLKN